MDDRNAKIVISADTSDYTSSVNESYEATNRLNQSLQQTTASMDGLIKRAGKKMVFFGTADLAALSSAVTVAATLDKQMSSLQASITSAGRSSDEFGKMRDQIRAISREIPVARGEIVQLYTAISKMGVSSTESVGKLTENFLKFGAAAGESPTGLAQAQIGLSRTMGNNSARSIMRFNDEANTLSSKAGVSAQGVLDFAQMLAPSARMANISQRDLLGISTAFNRAGADGGYAANAFNQIVNNITQMRQAGDPNLRIYASKLGLSNRQIQNGNAADIFSRLVSTVQSQGEQGISTLNSLGIDGLRTQRALQALSAEGSLPEWIKQGRQAYGGKFDSVEEGSKAAFSGLFDSLEKMKNNFTDLAQQLGQTVLPVVNSFAEGMAGVTKLITSAMQPITKALGPLMAGGGAALIAGGLTAQAVSALALPIMGRWLLNTRPGMGAKMGFQMGHAGMPSLVDMTPDQLAYTRALNNGDVGPVSSRAYRAGAWLGGHWRAGVSDRGWSPGQLVRQGYAGISGLYQMYANTTRDFYDQSTMRSGYEKVGRARPQGFLSSFWHGLRGNPALMGDPQNIESNSGVPRPSRPLLSDFKQSISNARLNPTITVLTRETGAAAAAMGRLALSATRAAGSLVGTGLGVATRGIGKGIAAAGSGLLSLVGGPTGAALLGMGGAAWMYQQGEKKNWAEGSEEVSSGLQAYSEKLGVATTSLMTFSDAVNRARDVAGGYQSYKEVQKDSSLSDKARKSPEYTSGAPMESVRNDKDALNWLYANDAQMTPEFLAEIKTDLYRRKQQNADLNINPDDVVAEYLKTRKERSQGKNTEYNAALEGARQTKQEKSGWTKAKQFLGNAGWWGDKPEWIDKADDWFNKTVLFGLGSDAQKKERERANERNAKWADSPVIEQGVDKEWSRIRTRESNLLNEYGGSKKGRKEINQMIRADLSSSLLELLKEGTPEAMAAANRLYSTAAGDQGKQLGMDGLYNFAARDWTKMSDEEVEKAFYEDRIVGKFDASKLQEVGEGHLKKRLDEGMSVSAQRFQGKKAYQGLPEMDKFALSTDDPLFQKAELRSGNANLQYRAIQRLRYYAGSQDLNLADRRLDAIIAEFGPGSALGQWAQTAQSYNNQEKSNQTSLLNTPGQVLSSIGTWQSALQSPNNADNVDKKRLETAQAAKESIINLYKTLQQYDRAMEREEEDFYRNRAWSMEDFYRSRQQSTAAYHRQMLYAEKEFNISRQRMEEDYQRSRRRSEADHTRGLRREEIDYNRQKQWSIDDFNRQQQYAQDDYNRQVRIQRREFNISLQRSDEDYQRSVERSNYDFNKSRMRAYRDYNLSLNRSIADFGKQQKRSEEDFLRSRQRSVDDFNLSLSRSFEDYNKSRIREEEDHNTQLTRMSKDAAKQFYDPWLRVQSQATAGVDTFVENLRDQQERIQRQFENLKKLRSRGLSQDAIDMFGLADPNKAQQLQRITVEMTDKQIAEINRLTKEREKGAKALTQSDFNEQFRRMEEDREKSLRRGEEDFKLSIERSIADFQKAMARSQEDYNLAIQRSYEDFNLSLARSAEDFTRSMNDSLEDYTLAMERGAEDYARSRKRSIEDFLRSMADSAEAFRISMERSEYEFNLSMSRQEKLRRIQLKRAENDWNRSLGQQARDFARTMRNMLQDRQRQVDQSNKEFRISLNISNQNFIRSLERAEAVRNTQLQRAKQDLIGFGRESFNNYDGILKRLLSLSRQHLGSAGNTLRTQIGQVWDKLFKDGKHAGDWLAGAYENYIDVIIRKMQKAIRKASLMASALARGLGGAANAGASSPVNPPKDNGGGSWAVGGVATGRVDGATVGEGGPELILPLNSRGMDYLTTALRQYAQTDAMRLRGTQSMFYQQPSQGNITQFNFGDVSVASDTPDQFYREMKQKESLKKLVGH